MLKPYEDRCDYGNLLTPSEGYETEFAAGATYSLDLDALTGVSLALGLSESVDGSMHDNPVCLLEALRKTADKIALFCECGQIKAPNKANQLYILLEKMIFEVNIGEKSFHPKVWVVKYSCPGAEAKYRFAVLSRNLTFDHSWDVVFTMDGVPGAEDGRSLPLADFVRYLARQIKPDGNYAQAKRQRLLEFAQELRNVNFSVDDNHFDFQFCPVGIKDENSKLLYGIDKTGLFNPCNELLIMSPFLANGIIEKLKEASKVENMTQTLITRKSELYKLKADTAKDFKIYTMKDEVIDGEYTLTSEDGPKSKQDIHAKVYLKTDGNRSDLYLGSLNASQNACYGNVEFMIRLMAKRRYLNMETLENELFCGSPDGKENPFELTELPKDQSAPDEASELLQKIVRTVCKTGASARADKTGNRYRLTVTFESLPELSGVKIKPLLCDKEKTISGRVVFDNLELLQLSEFYRISATDGHVTVQRVMKIETQNMPDSRESAVVNSIVSDKASFLQYITFLLGDNALLSMTESRSMEAQEGSSSRSAPPVPALYEQMLKVAASDPARLKGIDDLMKTIADSNVIPEAFDSLYSTFRKAAGI